MNKKIGILTFQDSPNYGANLQSYALQEVIKEFGYDVEVIDYHSPYRKYPRQSKLRRIRSVIWNNTAKMLFDSRIRKRKTANFKRKYLILSDRRYNTPDELKMVDDIYAAIVVGSDQVWNSHNLNGDESFWLPFAKEAKKISYAPSMGKNYIEETEKLKIKAYLSDFDSISVREPSGAKLLSAIMGKKIQVAIDPTFLLPIEKWDAICSERLLREKYILCYYMPGDSGLEKKIEEMAQQLSKMTGYRIINIGKKEYSKLRRNMGDRYDDGPLDFISLIKNAEFVVTNSFHGTVFSIIYKRPFWVPIHRGQKGGGGFNTRIVEMLTYLSLENRLKDADTEDRIQENELVLYDAALDAILSEKQSDSLAYLKGAIRRI